MSRWFLMTKSKSQSSTFSWVLSGGQRVAGFSTLSPSPNHRHFLESSAVLNELLICQNGVQFPVIHEIVSLEWSSTSWCSLKLGFISQSWTNWLQASIYWQMSACYAPDRWLVPSVGNSDFLCQWLRPFSSMWNKLVLSLCLNWMTHVLRKLLFVFDA